MKLSQCSSPKITEMIEERDECIDVLLSIKEIDDSDDVSIDGPSYCVVLSGDRRAAAIELLRQQAEANLDDANKALAEANIEIDLGRLVKSTDEVDAAPVDQAA